MKSQIHQLELIYPPITNQEAEWAKTDPDVKELLKNSKLYFIGQKPESYFEFPTDIQKIISDNATINFNLKCGTLVDSGQICLRELYVYYGNDPESFDKIELEIGDKLIRASQHNDAGKTVLDWFSTEKIVYDRSRNKPFINGLDRFKEFMVYNLHYIGISKTEDSLRRLVIKPHDKRLRILSNEHPLTPSSRTTDEIIIFFYKINTVEIQTDIKFDYNSIINAQLDTVKIVTDAEKAFVKIMNTEYNEVKFNTYPESLDGLYNSGIDKLCYILNEDITYITKDNQIKGGHNETFGMSHSDFITIDMYEKEVELVKIE